MTTLLLSFLPILSILAVFVYASVTGIRMYKAAGQVSVLGIAVALAGFTVGRLVERFANLPRQLDDWVNYRDAGTGFQPSTSAERILVVFSVEVALLFLFAAVIAFLAITLIRRDAAAQARTASRPGALPLLATLFVFAVCITARAKLAPFLAYLMAKAHLI